MSIKEKDKKKQKKNNNNKKLQINYSIHLRDVYALMIYTLFKNGGDFNILLSTFKLAILASFWIRYSFESLT